MIMKDFTEFSNMIDKDIDLCMKYLDLLEEMAEKNGGDITPEISVLAAKELGFSVDSEVLEKAARNMSQSDRELTTDELEAAAGGRSFGRMFVAWVNNGMPVTEKTSGRSRHVLYSEQKISPAGVEEQIRRII